MNFDLNFSGSRFRGPRRVLMTADTVGGVWTYALELARNLCEQDVEIALATMGAPLSEAQKLEAESLPNLRIFASTYKLEWMDQPWCDVRSAGEWLLALERKVRPDIIHLNSYAHGELPFAGPKLVAAHSDVLSWWRAVKGEEAPESWNRYRELVTAGLRAGDMVVAPSHAALTDVLHCYGPFARTEVIPNGREISCRQIAKEPFIFSSGRLWDEAKNISALAGVSRELTWPVQVAGDTHEPGKGKDDLHESLTNVRLLGRLSAEQMIEHLERAAIYCLPARYEPFGLSALEAALAGCALVLGDIPSQREIWREAAIFVPPQDAHRLRHSLQALIDDRELRENLARRAHERALEFTPRRMASSYLALYASFLEQRGHVLEDVCAS
jgi:glycogen synthase